MKPFRRYFFTGLVVVFPVMATVWILNFVFSFLPAVPEFLHDILLGGVVKWLPDVIFRIGVIIAFFVIVTFIGAFATHTIGARITAFFQGFLERIPLINRIYKAIQQITTALFSGKQVFRRVGLIEYPRKGLYTLTFITNDTEKRMENKINATFDREPNETEESQYVNLFVPTTPNPTSGFFIMIPREDIHILDISIEDALKLIMSGGAVHLEDIKKGIADEKMLNPEK